MIPPQGHIWEIITHKYVPVSMRKPQKPYRERFFRESGIGTDFAYGGA
jgi:hypothetical protein